MKLAILLGSLLLAWPALATNPEAHPGFLGRQADPTGAVIALTIGGLALLYAIWLALRGKFFVKR